MGVASLANIFLSFLNPESRRIFGLYERLSADEHVAHLSVVLNLAVFLCKEFTVISPGVLLECPIASRVLEANSDYGSARIIRYPMRERTLQELLDKKQSQYSVVRSEYKSMFRAGRSRSFLDKISAFIDKPVHSGKSIVANWEMAPDANQSWGELKEAMGSRLVEEVRELPRGLADDGLGITWPAMRDRLRSDVLEDFGERLRVELQREYLAGYIHHFSLRTISGVPFEAVELGGGRPDLCYDFDAVREALVACRLWSIVTRLDAASMIGLRATFGFHSFRHALDDMLRGCSSAREAGFAAAQAFHDCSMADGVTWQGHSGAADHLPRLSLGQAELMALAADMEALTPHLIEASGRVREVSMPRAPETGLADAARLRSQTRIESRTHRLSVLVVATEWDSKHGGLSTFNRGFCAALSEHGAYVVCQVNEANPDEKRRAEALGVTLVDASVRTAGYTESNDLRAGPFDAFEPDVIVGHDRITGGDAMSWAERSHPSSCRIVVIHTSPEEIEWHKEDQRGSIQVERAATRKKQQIDLASRCHLIAAVGPHLAKEFATDLHGVGNAVPIVSLVPGLPSVTQWSTSRLPPTIRCLVLGRVEDYRLKGLDIAARALGIVAKRWRSGKPPKLVVRGAQPGTETPLLTRLRRDSRAEGLDIVLRHYSADEREILCDLREASLVLMPSRKEGFGLVGLEAIAQGIPTLLSDESGLAESMREQVPQLAESWILPVTGRAAETWAARIEMLLASRLDAFARAAAVRDALNAAIDWPKSITAFIAAIEEVRRTRQVGAVRAKSSTPRRKPNGS